MVNDLASRVKARSGFTANLAGKNSIFQQRAVEKA
jgi:hypothetical protein